jgi:hypothetical protein
MAFNYSPKIVTDGLVLYLDAANQYSYVSGSTSWNDISRGGNNGTLVNGPTYNSANGGSIVFDGTNDYINIGTFQSLINSFTVSFYGRLPGGGFNIFGFYNTDSPYNGWGIGYAQNPFNGTRINFWDGTSWKDPNIVVVDNTWKHVSVVVSSTFLLSFYINGVFTNSVQGATITSYTGNKAIGGRPDGLGVMNGNIAQTQIYNRALSATEVLQNYNATKTRFGL